MKLLRWLFGRDSASEDAGLERRSADRNRADDRQRDKQEIAEGLHKAAREVHVLEWQHEAMKRGVPPKDT